MSMAAVESPRTDPRRESCHDPLPGTGYRALRRLGGGATSEVYEAIGPDRAGCAVKVLRSLFVDTPDAVFRLEQEGRALAALDHPSLVPVLDVGTTASGRPYFAMPLLDGRDGQGAPVARGPMAPAEACAIVIEVLEGARRRAPGGRGAPRRQAGQPLPAGARRGRPVRRCVVLDFGMAKLADAPRGAHHGLGRRGDTALSRAGADPRRRTSTRAPTCTRRADALRDDRRARCRSAGPGPSKQMRAHLEATPLRLGALSADLR